MKKIKTMLTVGKSLIVNYDDEKETPQLKLLHMMKKKNRFTDKNKKKKKQLKSMNRKRSKQ